MSRRRPGSLLVLSLALLLPLGPGARVHAQEGGEGGGADQAEADPFVGYFVAGLFAVGVAFAVGKSARRSTTGG